jgi:hypothetical protein
MSRSHRILLGSVVFAALLLPPKVATASSADADLVALATELRTLESAYNEGCREPYEWSETPETQALMIRLESLVKCMSATPAEGLTGIAAKAGRLCFSLHPRSGGMMCCEAPLVASLAEDLARLVPHAVGDAT